MALPTKDTFTFDWTAQPDYPNWTPLQTKQNLNARDEELRLALNDVVDKLNAITSGASGADQVGATPPTGLSVSANTVQAVLNALKSAIDSTALGQIPDGSLTDVKLSNASTEIKQRFASHLADNAKHVTKDGTLQTGLNADMFDGYHASSFPLLGTTNTDINKVKALELKTDTRSVVLTYTGSQLTKVEEKNETTVVKTTNLTYDANGNLTQVQEIAGGTTVTTTLTYTSGTLTSVTKAVS